MKSKTTKEEIQEDLGTYKAIEVLASTEGGKILINTAYKEIKSNIETIANVYKSATHAELVSYCAALKANLDFLRVLRNAKTNAELAEEALKNIEE